jgi:hypothetical protein
VENLPEAETVTPTLIACGVSAHKSDAEMETLRRNMLAIQIEYSFFFMMFTSLKDIQPIPQHPCRLNFKSHPARVWMAFT